jgi:NTE family protein
VRIQLGAVPTAHHAPILRHRLKIVTDCADVASMARRATTAGQEMPRLSVAFGGGGPFGIAYGLGVVDALVDAGVSFRGVDMLGTSAGSWVAACVATGVGYNDLCRIPAVRVPNPRPGLLRGIASELFGDAGSARVTASALRVSTARPSLLSGADHRLADVVAASSAVPGLFAPARVGRRWYVDGGVRSLVSAHRATPAQHLLVVAPIAGPMFGPAGRMMELMLREEVARWQRATGGKAHLVRPNARIARIARQPLHLFDKARAVDAYPLAYAQARRLVSERPGLAALVAPTYDAAA